MSSASNPAPHRAPLPGKRFLLGAAIGTGMAAKAAERGGADFVLALNAGRFRSMGLPSAACLLALRDANRLVMEFGRSEVLTQTSLPVYFGASALGIADLESFVTRVSGYGFHGITNFPSCIFLDGRYRQYLENSGIGFEREIALLRAARAHGLSTVAYVRTLEEARRAVRAGIEMVNLDFGWNVGGLVGARSSVHLDEAAIQARDLVKSVRAISAQTRCLIEGGPIVTPEQMDRVCRAAGADGYIGGSTIDRVPLEAAIEMTTNAFKTIGQLRQQVESLERKLHRRVGVEALIGFSDVMERAREQTAQAADCDRPVLITGEPGTGRSSIARLIHESRIKQGRTLFSVDCDGSDELEGLLFGCAGAPGNRNRTGLLEQARGSTLVLSNVERLSIPLQLRLLKTVQAESGDDAFNVRIIGTCSTSSGATSKDRQLSKRFYNWLSSIRIELPALRDHLEDLPMIANAVLRTISVGERKRFDPSAHRALLGNRWESNFDELRSVIQAAASAARGSVIMEDDVLRVLKSSPGSNRKSFASEREWILDAMRRNRFRRADTARFLRISRKTLYNKILKYGLLRPTAANAN